MAEKVSDKLAALAEGQLADKVRDSANQIWLAGLGAYAKAEAEGSKLFDALVQDGERLEVRTRSYLDRHITTARDKVDGLRARASGSWNKVERAFDDRVSSALSRLNIPGRGEVDEVVARLDEISADIDLLALKVAEKKQSRAQ
jgi:poly(hydroxyalkanoate) granule-associated protein